MENILETIKNIQPYIVLGLAVAVLLLLALVVILFSSLNKLEKKYRRMMRGVNNKNLEELILGYLDKIDEANERSEGIKDAYSFLDNRIKGCIQKTAMMRYKAFSDIGSDLSFSIALLDGSNNGMILTGIYGRNESTTYAKPVDDGISRYDLSDEEQQVLQEAMLK